MKTISIIFCLVIGLVINYSQPVSLMESDGVIYVIDATPEEYVEPEPVDTSVKIPEFIKKMNVIDWGVVTGIIPGLPSD